MAILSVRQLPLEQGSQTIRGNVDGSTRVVSYIVLSDDYVSDFQNDVILDAEDPNTSLKIPQYLDADGENTKRRVRDKAVTPRGGNDTEYAFQVDVTYDTKSDYGGFNLDDLIYEPDPTLRAAEIQWSFERTPEVAQFALAEWVLNTQTSNPTDYHWNTADWVQVNGKNVSVPIKLTNSAGQPFNPPLTIDTITMVGVMERWQTTWDRSQALQYQVHGGAVNSDYWLDFDPGQARVHSITGSRRLESGQYLWRVRYEIHVREHWITIIEDLGYNVDSTGTPIGGPIRLDGNGSALADQQNDPAVFLYFKTHPELPFSDLNIA